jgi:hypothetical protein
LDRPIQRVGDLVGAFVATWVRRAVGRRGSIGLGAV